MALMVSEAVLLSMDECMSSVAFKVMYVACFLAFLFVCLSVLFMKGKGMQGRLLGDIDRDEANPSLI